MVWKTVEPFFSDKGPMRQKITLIEKDEIQGNNKEIQGNNKEIQGSEIQGNNKEIQGNNKEISEILHNFSRV